MPNRFLANRASAVLAFLLFWGSGNAYAQSTAVTSVAPPTTVYDRTPLGKKPEADEAEPLVEWLPIWGAQAKSKSFDLPLPFGFGLTYTYILLLGGNWEINKRWSLTAEVGGVMDRFHTIGALMWRF